MLSKKYTFYSVTVLCSFLYASSAFAASVTHSTKIRVSLTIPPNISSSTTAGSDQRDNTLCVTSRNVKQYRLHAAGQNNVIKSENGDVYRIEPGTGQAAGLVATNYTDKRTAPVNCSSQVVSPTDDSLNIPRVINHTEAAAGVVISAE